MVDDPGEGEDCGRLEGGQGGELRLRQIGEVARPVVVVDPAPVAADGLPGLKLEVDGEDAADTDSAQLFAAEAVARAEVERALAGRRAEELLELAAAYRTTRNPSAER